jgi:hypothetical protein
MEQRRRGCQNALAASGIPFDKAPVYPAPSTRRDGNVAMGALLGAAPPIEAAVRCNDLLASGAGAALGERSLEAGQDFALTGFDNVLDAAHSNAPLSTVDIRPGERGERDAAGRLQTPGRPESGLKAPGRDESGGRPPGNRHKASRPGWPETSTRPNGAPRPLSRRRSSRAGAAATATAVASR